MRFIKKHSKKTAAFVFGIILLLLFFSPAGQTTFKTALILPEFLPNSKFRPLTLFTPNPVVKEVVYKSQGREVHADLWLPKPEGKYPAAVLHLGVDVDRKDPRVERVAEAVSRTGIALLVPNVQSLSSRRVLYTSKEDLINSFKYLKENPQVEADRLGFVGFCASGGLVLVAAEDEEISDQVDFIVAVNPYYDLVNIYKNIVTEKIEFGGESYPWYPDPKTIEIYNRETIELLEDGGEKELLNHSLVLIGRERLVRKDYEKLSPKKLSSLSPEARLTYEQLTTKPEKVDFYVSTATEEQKEFLTNLSPSSKIDKLKAKTFVFVDKNNVYIPFTESELLSDALGEREKVFVETKLLPADDINPDLSMVEYLAEAVKVSKFVFMFLRQVN